MMSPNAQREAIAEICGYKRTSSVSGNGPAWQNGAEYFTRIPDYLNDLNAMHEAEKTLDYNQMNRYQNIELSRFVHTGTTWICSATAAQRAEAFLRTIGKWSID